MEDFEETSEVVDININSYGELLPEKNDKIALIDADTLVYTACLNAEEKVDLMPKEWYSMDEWEEILLNPTYDEGEHAIYTSDLNLCIEYAKQKLQKILDLTGCQSYELHFTGGKRNSFRYQFYKDYKANRTTRTPLFLRETKQYFADFKDNWIHDYVEADDVVVYLKNKYPDKYILCCVDKDVYNAVEGTHFNYYESMRFNKNMSFVTTSSEHAKMWPYKQAIMGDKSDNIIGINGIGPKKVEKYIDSVDDLEERLIQCFIENGRTKEDALLNLLLVTCGDPKIVEPYLQKLEGFNL